MHHRLLCFSMKLQAFHLYRIILPFTLLLWQCQSKVSDLPNLQTQVAGIESITGKPEYLNSSFVTAGDRLYMVGHQNGQFPDLGWHVTGEMGGIWDHPIKLMDGFTAAIRLNNQTYCLEKADTFINYPFGNQHIYNANAAGLKVERFQFVPDGQEAVVVAYTFTNTEAEAKEISFDFNGMIDLRPVWLGERTGLHDSGDYAFSDADLQTIIAKDSLNEWYVVFGTPLAPEAYQLQAATCVTEHIGKGCNATLSYNLTIPPNSSISLPFTIAGSYHSLSEAKETYQTVSKDLAQLLENKKERYESLVRQTQLDIPDQQLAQTFRWLKYNTDWLIRDVPETGRGLSAGIPDYPWWFGADSEYALQGALAIGRTDLVYSTIDLLHTLSEKTNGNGRILHEVSTNGAVFNPGNINETPQFASLIWTVYRWTGDKAFLEKYYPTIKKGLAWLLAENDADGNLLPDGFGMMEIHGLNSEMIDVAVYTQKAFADAAQMATALGETREAEGYQKIADQLRIKINKDFWVPESNSYADFIGTTKQALHLIDDAIIRADTLGKPWAVTELNATKNKIETYPPNHKQGFVLHHNWVVNTPMETGIADPAKAESALETGRNFVNPFGMFVTGIDRDETAGTDDSSFAKDRKIFSYTGAVMTLPTGVQAIAENNYDHPDQALDYLQRLTRSFSYAFPGSMYEVSPDYGMITQAWNIYSIAVPVVRQFFGIDPMAQDRTIYIHPQMPSDWEQAAVQNVKIGDNALSLKYQMTGNTTTLLINQTQGNWKIIISFPEGKFQSWTLNGAVAQPETSSNHRMVEVSGNDISLVLRE